jgi:UPF0716 protein FxsA
MRFALYLILAAIPLLEIVILVQVGKSIGLWWTLGLVMAMAAGGTYVLNLQGFVMMNRVMEAMSQGKPPVGAVIDGAFLMIAGLLFITPGLLTDVLGLLLLIPPLRRALAAWTVRKVMRSATVRTATFRQEQTVWPGQGAAKENPGRNSHDQAHAPGDGPVIDGEFERIDERTLDARRRANGDARPNPPRSDSDTSRH